MRLFLRRVVKTCEQLGQGRLTGAVLSNERDHLASVDRQIY